MDRRKLLRLGLLTAAGSFVPGMDRPVQAKRMDRVRFDPNERIRLNANENVYAPSPAAKEAAREALAQANRYPLVSALPQLKKAIARHHKVEESMVFITAGSLQALKVIGMRLSEGNGNHVAPDLSFTAVAGKKFR